MDAPLVVGIEELEAHLHELSQAPDTPLQAKLFDGVELQLTSKSEKASLNAHDCEDGW